RQDVADAPRRDVEIGMRRIARDVCAREVQTQPCMRIIAPERLQRLKDERGMRHDKLRAGLTRTVEGLARDGERGEHVVRIGIGVANAESRLIPIVRELGWRPTFERRDDLVYLHAARSMETAA